MASFFSGIGGLDLGLERSGFTIHFHCEINPFCRDILRQHWPNLSVHHDIRRLDDSEIPKADVWAAGFPCQDLSLARMGPRSGLRGSQSGPFMNLCASFENRPRAIILENVHGLLSSHGGRDFAIALKALDELGYGVAWRVETSESPSSVAASTLLPCIEAGEIPGKYFLSPNAAIGILRRVDQMGRSLPLSDSHWRYSPRPPRKKHCPLHVRRVGPTHGHRLVSKLRVVSLAGFDALRQSKLSAYKAFRITGHCRWRSKKSRPNESTV